jgi:acetolactate synthase-1/2/3 large subunit
MHNARRANTPVVNVIGDMATWHKGADPLLNMDIPRLAATVSEVVIECKDGDNLSEKMGEACTAAESFTEAGGSRVSTLIVPHNLAWERTEVIKKMSPKVEALKINGSASPIKFSPAIENFLNSCAEAIKKCPRNKAALYIGGQAALADNGALKAAGQIAAAVGAVLLCENSFARLDRGQGLPAVQRLPYFPQDAAAALAAFQVLVICDARQPVANFGYENGPSTLINQPDSNVWELDASDVDISEALKYLSNAVGGDAIKPLINCRGMFCPAARSSLPKGRLNPTSLCQLIAHLQPENAIIVDESLTSGNAYWEASKGCPQFSHMCLTGGAIGCGPPLSIGAAVACPQRVIINFQADGSAMYSAQALWTQAREGLKVITVICANRTYAILKVEMAKQRITPSNGPASKALTDISNPPIDWVKLAQSMGVSAARADTCEQLAEQFAAALDRPGPSLIEAALQ